MESGRDQTLVCSSESSTWNPERADRDRRLSGPVNPANTSIIHAVDARSGAAAAITGERVDNLQQLCTVVRLVRSSKLRQTLRDSLQGDADSIWRNAWRPNLILHTRCPGGSPVSRTARLLEFIFGRASRFTSLILIPAKWSQSQNEHFIN